MPRIELFFGRHDQEQLKTTFWLKFQNAKKVKKTEKKEKVSVLSSESIKI